MTIIKIIFFKIEVSSELGIVSHAKIAWDMSTKTNEHVNEVIIKQGKLYVM